MTEFHNVSYRGASRRKSRMATLTYRVNKPINRGGVNTSGSHVRVGKREAQGVAGGGGNLLVYERRWANNSLRLLSPPTFKKANAIAISLSCGSRFAFAATARMTSR